MGPYETLGVSPDIPDEGLRSAYRRLVQLHHPDHNRGSAEAARRFEEIQEAYAEVRKLREHKPPGEPPAARTSSTPRAPSDPAVDLRLADLERELREAAAARERARQAAREAAQDAAAQTRGRPSDDELGYVKTDDSFAKIFADARDELSGRLFGDDQHPAARRVADLIDELEDLGSGLKRPRRPRERP